MARRTRFLYSPSLLDVTFALAGVGAAVLLSLGPVVSHPVRAPVDRPDWMGVTLVAVLAASAMLAAFTSRLDQKCADDFVFMTLAKSALIALTTLILVVVFWELLFSSSMGDLPGAATIPMVMVAWALAWFYTRVRGTGA